MLVHGTERVVIFQDGISEVLALGVGRRRVPGDHEHFNLLTRPERQPLKKHFAKLADLDFSPVRFHLFSIEDLGV